MKHAVHTVFKETVEAVTPVSNVSQFRDKGVLTPEEFVAAGSLATIICFELNTIWISALTSSFDTHFLMFTFVSVT